jgi:hypothetical protein
MCRLSKETKHGVGRGDVQFDDLEWRDLLHAGGAE